MLSYLRLRQFFGGCLFIVIVSFAIWGLYYTKPQAPEISQPPVREMRVWSLSHSSHRPLLRLYAHLHADESAVYSGQISATVAKVCVRLGDQVQAGDVLVLLDGRRLKLRLEEAQAQLDALQAQAALAQTELDQAVLRVESAQTRFQLEQREYVRQQDLYAQKVLAKQSFDAASLVFNEARNKLAGQRDHLAKMRAQVPVKRSLVQKQRMVIAQLRYDLDKTRIVANGSARVHSIDVMANDVVQPHTKLLTLLDPEGWQVRALLPYQYVPVVEKILAVDKPDWDAWVDIYAQRYALRPQRIAPSRQHPSLGAQLRLGLELPEQSPSLYDQQGLWVYLRMPMLENVFAIPPAALALDQYVYIIDSEQRLQRVELEILGETWYQSQVWPLVRSTALKQGDLLVVDPVDSLTSGSRVQPRRVDAL